VPWPKAPGPGLASGQPFATSNTMIALGPILVGGLLLAYMGRPAVTYFKGAARRRRKDAG
jgi:hypothetical protein